MKTEGIVLKSINYGEYDRLLTLFTPDFGVVKLRIPRANSRRKGLQGLTSPLIRAEWVFEAGKGEFCRFQDGKMMDGYIPLRKNLEALEAAASILRHVQQTQLPGNPAPQLYALLALYLKALEDSTVATAISTSFILKALKHDGLCDGDARGIDLSSEESAALQVLSESRSLKEVSTTPCSHELRDKVLNWAKLLREF